MINFLLLLRGHWQTTGLVILFAITFFIGWHLRGIQDDVKELRAVKAKIEADNKIGSVFEYDKQKLDDYYNNLNTKVTYENAYSCNIPADGLRLLSQATR